MVRMGRGSNSQVGDTALQIHLGMSKGQSVFFSPVKVPRQAIQGWYGGLIIISNLVVFYLCVSPSLAKGFHPQSCLTAQDSCWNSNHHICITLHRATKTEGNSSQNRPVAILQSQLLQPSPPLQLSLCRARYYLCPASTLLGPFWSRPHGA